MRRREFMKLAIGAVVGGPLTVQGVAIDMFTGETDRYVFIGTSPLPPQTVYFSTVGNPMNWGE